MRSDGTQSRRFIVPLITCELRVRERLTGANTHDCVVRIVVDDQLMLVTRVVVLADGSIGFGPKEEYRHPGFPGGWLPIEFDYDDFVSLIRLRL